ncbi:CLUMA_CG019697, isoform A [Clunio marinus]|uniref:CLUMA_CG019697, isoform A n=1 Tax=Clunio marinus TaxID=568069 RepID=A0A1J1J2X7_9DIPT|nr:CLUMA_CG019697, isoform A [Clunio marinus]
MRIILRNEGNIMKFRCFYDFTIHFVYCYVKALKNHKTYLFYLELADNYAQVSAHPSSTSIKPLQDIGKCKILHTLAEYLIIQPFVALANESNEKLLEMLKF